MKSKALHNLMFLIIADLRLGVSVAYSFAQSQPLNGQIEDTVLDQRGCVERRRHGNEYRNRREQNCDNRRKRVLSLSAACALRRFTQQRCCYHQ